MDLGHRREKQNQLTELNLEARKADVERLRLPVSGQDAALWTYLTGKQRDARRPEPGEAPVRTCTGSRLRGFPTPAFRESVPADAG